MNPPDNSVEKMLNVAITAARRAGAILSEGFHRPKTTAFKGEIDLVTEYDLAAEKEVVAHISEAFPDHAILAEEGGLSGQESPYCWYIDPLDGTTNFSNGFPVFAVSIGLEAPALAGPEMLLGVIYDPLREDLFWAVKGRGARHNDRPLKVSSKHELDQALLATGFPYYVHHGPASIFRRFEAMCRMARGIRRCGAASLDLAYLAAGRLDGFWEEGLKPWDTAAGMILISEAGGMITDFCGHPFKPQMKEILATNGRLHYNMLEILKRVAEGD